MKMIVEDLRSSGGVRNADEVLTSLVSQDSELEFQLRSLGVLPEGSNPLDRPLSDLAASVERGLPLKEQVILVRWKNVLQDGNHPRCTRGRGGHAFASANFLAISQSES